MNIKALMAALVAVAMIGSAFGQGAGPRGGQNGGQGGAKAGQGKGGRPGQGMGMRRGGPMGFDGPILAKLNLTKDQQAKVKSLKEKLGKSTRDTMEKNRGNRDAMRTALMGVGKQYRDGMAKILTPAQQKQYTALMKTERDKRRKEMGNRRPGGRQTPPPAAN